MPYIAKLEKAGIPTVTVDFDDQRHMIKEWALMQGVPNIRTVHEGRILPGPVEIENWIEPLLEALTKPLTEDEKKGGKWQPSNQQRILFEGTLDEAQTFYQQTQYLPSPVNAPICVYTDGYPIIIPTEEKVREMLTGTSHKPDEVISYQHDVGLEAGLRRESHKKGETVQFQPSIWRTATVEKVAINAVMAGCKPEHLPIVLAMAQSGCPTGTTGNQGQLSIVSGPVVKEIGMNSGCGLFNSGNPANVAIGRAYDLMAINLGGAVPGVSRMASQGTAINRGGFCFAENVEGLPPGWKGLNEEHGFKKDESVIMVMSAAAIRSQGFPPGTHRAFQKSGHGGMARGLGVKGIPGPHNWLAYLLPIITPYAETGRVLVMIPELAHRLYEYGFKSKQEVYEWFWKATFEPVGQFRLRSGPDLTTNGWMGIEKTSGKHWKELPDDYMVPTKGDEPFANCIIVGGGEEEHCEIIDGGRGTAYSIDAWR
ncbi:MAG: hypothetical protein HYX80_08325 [Chloroflexi bacterium]|nr:hypothetical protein [Chloroflexota bacterium]